MNMNTQQGIRMGRGHGHRGNFFSRKIPDGWVGCPSMSTGYVDERFLVFKTPLKPQLNHNVPPTERFSIDNVIQRLNMDNTRVGLWIDLTNTSRYYDASTVYNYGIEYMKLNCEGHGRPPTNRDVRRFCDTVHQFFRYNHREYIAVHCTHGFNRTGYLICSYLIRYRRYTAEEAVMEFAKHREPGIYRQNYVNCLYTMSMPYKNPINVTQPNWLQMPAQEPFTNLNSRGRSSTSVKDSIEDQNQVAGASTSKSMDAGWRDPARRCTNTRKQSQSNTSTNDSSLSSTSIQPPN